MGRGINKLHFSQTFLFIHILNLPVFDEHWNYENVLYLKYNAYVLSFVQFSFSRIKVLFHSGYWYIYILHGRFILLEQSQTCSCANEVALNGKNLQIWDTIHNKFRLVYHILYIFCCYSLPRYWCWIPPVTFARQWRSPVYYHLDTLLVNGVNHNTTAQLFVYFPEFEISKHVHVWRFVVLCCSLVGLDLIPIFMVSSLTMMTWSNGNILRVTGHLCGELTSHRWIPRTKASDAELWCFLWSAPE